MPRKVIEIDFKILDNIFAVGGSIGMAATILEVSHDTIERRIKAKSNMTAKEYRDAKLDRTRVRLQQKAIDMALNKDNVTLLIFCLKNLCNWSDKNVDAKELANEIRLAYSLDDAKGDNMAYGKGGKKGTKKGTKKGGKKSK